MGQVIKVGMADLNICKEPDILTTIGLGSCIGIALYDPTTKISGLAHIMLPDSTQIRNNSNIAKFALIKEKLYMYNTTSPSIVRSSFSLKKIHDYILGIRHVYNYFMAQNKNDEWNIVRKKRISLSLKMVLSKITKSTENKDELEAYFKQEYLKLKSEGIVSFMDLTLKSKFRLLRLMWHQRHK